MSSVAATAAAKPVTTFWRIAGLSYLQVRVFLLSRRRADDRSFSDALSLCGVCVCFILLFVGLGVVLLLATTYCLLVLGPFLPLVVLSLTHTSIAPLPPLGSSTLSSFSFAPPNTPSTYFVPFPPAARNLDSHVFVFTRTRQISKKQINKTKPNQNQTKNKTKHTLPLVSIWMQPQRPYGGHSKNRPKK